MQLWKQLGGSLALVALGGAGGYAVANQDAAARYDPLEAAPVYYRVVLENDAVRVLNVVIPPGATVPAHQHRHPGLLLTLSPARRVIRDAEGNALRELPAPLAGRPGPEIEWQDADAAPQSVSNNDTVGFRALRIDVKPPVIP